MFRAPLAFLFLISAFPLMAEFPQDKSDLLAEDTITWGELDNGIRYAVMPNKEPPGRVSVRLLVEAGSLMESDAQQGLAHFLEHMAFNGSENFPPGELIEYLQRIGMSFGADTNAHTSFDETVYKLELPGNNEETLREGMQVMRDYATELLLLDEEIEKERGVIMAEKRARDSAQYRTSIAWFDFAFPDSLLSKRLPIGTEEVIQNAPREQFVDFYEGWYTSDRFALVVVGDVTVDEVVPLIKEYFDGVPKNPSPRPDPDLGSIIEPKLATMLHSESELPATTISIFTMQPFSGKKDSKARRMEKMTIALANRMITRRLDILSKQEDSPISEGSASWFDFMDFVEAAEIEVTTKPDDWQAALDMAEQQIRKALEYGFTESELKEATANMLQGYEQAVREASTRKSRGLSSGIADSISNDRVFTSPQTSLAVAEELLGSVTPEDALTALRSIWSAPNRLVFVSGNLELDDSESKIRTAFIKSTQKQVTPPEEQETPDFAYTNFGKAGTVKKESYHEDLGIHQLIFENGVRLNFKQTDYEAGQVLVNATFGGGKLAEPESLVGIAQFTDAVYTRGGLEAHSFDEIKRITAGKTVGVGFSVNEGSFSLSGGTNSEDALMQMQLMTAFLTAPGYREEAARLARKDFEEMYISLNHTAEGLLRNKVAKTLSGGSYRFGYPSEEVLLSRTMQEVKAWLNMPLKNAYLEISIVGDIEFADAKTYVAQTFGALPKRAEKPESFAEARKSVVFPKDLPRDQVDFKSEIPRALSCVFWSTDDFWDVNRTRTLNFLGSIFRDRLRLKVREELGDGYSPFAVSRSNETYKGFGYIMAVNFCDPAKTAQVTDIIANLGKELGTGNITEDERDRALKPMLNQIEVTRRDNSYWLGRVLIGSSSHPELLDFARSLPTGYQAISLDDLNHNAKQYFGDAGTSLEVEIVPLTAEET